MDSSQVEVREIRYRYRNDDLRVRKEVFNASGTKVLDENYVYDAGQLVLTLDGNGNPLRRYLNGAGVDSLLVDEAFSNGSVTDTLWAANDYQGSVRQLVDSADHSVVEHREFDSFGELAELYDETGALQQSGGEPDTAALDSAFAFAGREWDEEAQLYYNRARYYDASVGRFLGEDPALADPNLYRYAGNDPVNYRDPTGLFSFGGFGGFGGFDFGGVLGSFSFGELGFVNGFLDGTAGFSLDVGALFDGLGSLFSRDPFSLSGLALTGGGSGLSSQSLEHFTIDCMGTRSGRTSQPHLAWSHFCEPHQ